MIVDCTKLRTIWGTVDRGVAGGGIILIETKFDFERIEGDVIMTVKDINEEEMNKFFRILEVLKSSKN